MSELPYSYHTFLFPFLWDDGGETQKADFEKVLSTKSRWRKSSWEHEEIPEGKNQDEWLQDYAAFQYFTEPANTAIFNTREEHSVMQCFEYRYNGQSPKEAEGKYVISKDGDVFGLNINDIRMHVYDSGVAILILELENAQPEHSSLDDVNKINEYGRRINMPFLTSDDEHPVCADQMEIFFGKTCFEKENYKKTLDELRNNFEVKKKKITLNYIMQPIQKLIDGGGKDNGGYKVTSNAVHKSSQKLFIKPCIDDRMFVCCMVNDGEFAKRARQYNIIEKEYHYLTDCDLWSADGNGGFIPAKDTISNEIYKLCYIATGLTCQSVTMKRELLKNSIYDRWIDYGTFHAMTHHSLVCVSTYKPAIDAFLTEYIQLAILVLAQRATILALSGNAATVAESFKIGVHITPKQIKDIEQLQAKYVKSQNQLFLSEVTVQEQGVEVYSHIRNHLYIDINKAVLEEQMSNLREVANISNARMERKSDNDLNNYLLYLSLIGIILAIIQAIPVILNPDCSLWLRMLFGGFVIVVVVTAFICFVKRKFPRKGCKEIINNPHQKE